MRSHQRLRAGDLVANVLADGRYLLSRREVERRLKVSPVAAYFALRRLVAARQLVRVRPRLYLAVDPQHRVAGTMPPEWFIHDLMQDLGRAYYVGLLSAAQVHGAAHHQPQVFQVGVEGRGGRSLKIGNIHIRFFGKGEFKHSRWVRVKTPTGFMHVSDPETTAWDLTRYVSIAGGLGHVVTVLAELAPRLDRKRLADSVRRHDDHLVARRLGYLLDKIGRKELARGISGCVGHGPIRRLDAFAPAGRARASERWRLLINADVRSET